MTRLRCVECVFAFVLASVLVAGAGVNRALAQTAGGTLALVALSPAPLSFGTVQSGNTTAREEHAQNVGKVTVTVYQASLNGAGFHFSGPSLPFALKPGAGLSFKIVFTPPSSRQFTGSFTVRYRWRNTSWHSASRTIHVFGTAAGATRQISHSPSSISFGTLQVSASKSMTESLANSGGAPLTISQIVVSGRSFSFSGINPPVTLYPGQSVNFPVTFAPTSSGASSGDLSITSNASNSTVSVPLAGNGSMPGQLTLTPTSVNFGNVVVGTSQNRAATLSAAGGPVTVSSANISNAEFSISGISLPATIAAGGSAPVTLIFRPQSSGTATGTLTLTSTATNFPPTASMAGNGTSPLAINTISLPESTANSNYAATISATGGTLPYTWSIASGTLPPGLILAATSGEISGIPSSIGTYTFTSQVTDSESPAQPATHVFNIVVGSGTSTHPDQIPSTFFGMTLINKGNWPTVPIGALGKGTLVNWSYSEPTRGVFDWSNLDAWVKVAEDNRVDYFFSNDLIPPWAAADPSTCGPTYPGSPVIGCTSMVANIQDWDDFVTALATRYKGKIQIYELWNEPDEKTFTGTVADMAVLTTHMYDIIRKIDPAAIIVAPSGGAGYMDKFWAAGGVKTVDVISIHAYPDLVNVVPEKINGFLSQPMKVVVSKYGLSGKPLWDTEGSWGNEDIRAFIDADKQAAFVARYYLLHWSDGISRLYWYAWDDDQDGTLWDRAQGAHPAATAYEQVYKWMVGATMNMPCSVSSDSTWTCGFIRPGGYQALAVWNALASTTYIVPSQYNQYADLNGNKIAIPASRSVAIGSKPILLETF